jgi:alpha-tubulin suppressor-like RCC1 family protein
MKLLLISRSVPDFQVFVDAANEDTRAVLYSSSMTQSELLESIQLTSAERIAVVSRKEDSFVENKSIPENVELFKSLIQTLGVNTFDFLACNTLLDPLWTQFYTSLQTTGVTVGASNDRTGNLKYGGDWTMESTGQDIETVYFNKSIEYYKYLLDFGYITLFVKSDGMYGSGNTYNRQLGVDGTYSVNSPVTKFTKITSPQIGFDKKKVQFSCGAEHTVVILEDGTLWGAGEGYYMGMSGLINVFTKITSPNVGFDKKKIQVSCGVLDTSVILEDGTLWSAWRGDYMGMNGGSSVTGTMNAFTKITSPNIGFDKKKVQVSCGEIHNVVILEDGTLWGLGNGTFMGMNGTLTNFTKITSTDQGFNKKKVHVSCGDYHTVVLLEDGTLWGAGDGNAMGMFNQLSVFTKITTTESGFDKKIVHVSCGPRYTMVILEDGTLWGAGFNGNRYLGIDESTVNIFTKITSPDVGFGKKKVQVYCSRTHVLVLLEDGTLWGAGNNQGNVLGLSEDRIDEIVYTFIKIEQNVLFIKKPAINADSSPIGKMYFPVNSYVNTDQGYIYVSNLDPVVHTIMGHRILSITEVYNDTTLEKVLVFIKKDSYNDFPRLLS